MAVYYHVCIALMRCVLGERPRPILRNRLFLNRSGSIGPQVMLNSKSTSRINLSLSDSIRTRSAKYSWRRRFSIFIFCFSIILALFASSFVFRRAILATTSLCNFLCLVKMSKGNMICLMIIYIKRRAILTFQLFC